MLNIPEIIAQAALEAFGARSLARDARNYSEEASRLLEAAALAHEAIVSEWAAGRVECPSCGDDTSMPCRYCASQGWEVDAVIEAVYEAMQGRESILRAA